MKSETTTDMLSEFLNLIKRKTMMPNLNGYRNIQDLTDDPERIDNYRIVGKGSDLYIVRHSNFNDEFVLMSISLEEAKEIRSDFTNESFSLSREQWFIHFNTLARYIYISTYKHCCTDSSCLYYGEPLVDKGYGYPICQSTPKRSFLSRLPIDPCFIR